MAYSVARSIAFRHSGYRINIRAFAHLTPNATPIPKSSDITKPVARLKPVQSKEPTCVALTDGLFGAIQTSNTPTVNPTIVAVQQGGARCFRPAAAGRVESRKAVLYFADADGNARAPVKSGSNIRRDPTGRTGMRFTCGA